MPLFDVEQLIALFQQSEFAKIIANFEENSSSLTDLDAANFVCMSYIKQKQFERAGLIYKEFIPFPKKQIELYFNYLLCLWESGNFSECKNLAIKFSNGKKERPLTIKSLRFLLEMCCSLPSLFTLNELNSFLKIARRIPFRNDPLVQVYASIICVKLLDLSHAKTFISINSSNHIPLNSTQDYFVNAFKRLIPKLIDWKLEHYPDKSAPAFNLDFQLSIIGDSHSLASAIGFNQLSTSHALIFGVKAIHLDDTSSKYVHLLHHNLNRLEIDAPTLISIGEIDCRVEEGIIQTSIKRGLDPIELTKLTVRKYLDGIVKLNAKNRKIILANVPAPVYLGEKSELERSVIRTFNSEIVNNLKLSIFDNFEVLDLYAVTLGDDGYSNKKYHIDNRHISPLAYRDALYT